MKFSSTIFIFSVLAVTCIQAISEEFSAKLEDEVKRCEEITGADRSIVARLWSGEDAPVDEKIKCFGACFMKGLGVMEDDGNIDKEQAKAMAEEFTSDHEILTTINGCFNQKDPNECETAHLILHCLLEHKLHLKKPTE